MILDCRFGLGPTGVSLSRILGNNYRGNEMGNIWGYTWGRCLCIVLCFCDDGVTIATLLLW